MAVQRDAHTALAVRSGQGASSRSNTFNRKPLHCSYCDNDHHVRDTCWKLHGYPPGHPKHKTSRFHRQGSRPPYNKSAHPSAHYVKEGPTRQEMQSVMNGFSDLQLQQILSIMNNNGTEQSPQPQANTAVNSPGLLQPYSLPQLILDSGATDHITSSPNLLVNSRQNSILPPVTMPSGEQAPITSTGNLPLNSVISLNNVLGVPSFKDLATKTTIGLATSPVLPLSIPNTPATDFPVSNPAPPSVPNNITQSSPPLIPMQPLRRSQRHHSPPPALRDYICHQVTSPKPSLASSSGSSKGTRYPLCNFLSYHRYSPQLCSYTAIISQDIEPCSYTEAASLPHHIKVDLAKVSLAHDVLPNPDQGLVRLLPFKNFGETTLGVLTEDPFIIVLDSPLCISLFSGHAFFGFLHLVDLHYEETMIKP
uniref:Uncharacterized protein n=1 Tax=Populus alba TaxID=43335 RepID=A0A4U5PLT1_POPAL|nr:hypothetical protein D5086_0000213150 [Populus alba]